MGLRNTRRGVVGNSQIVLPSGMNPGAYNVMRMRYFTYPVHLLLQPRPPKRSAPLRQQQRRRGQMRGEGAAAALLRARALKTERETIAPE